MYIDIKEIASRLSIADVADVLDLQIVAHSGKPRAKCPACDSDRALALYPESNSFYCWSRRVGGDSVSLYSHVKEMDNKDSARELAERFGLVQKPAEKAPEAPKKGFDVNAYRGALAVEHPLLAEIPPEVCRLAGIGVALKGAHQGKIAVPLYDQAGNFLVYASVEGLKLPKNWTLPRT